MLQRTWVTSANCVDSAQILWEILCEVRSFAHHQRFTFRRRSEEKTHDRLDEKGLLTHWVQTLQRNGRMAISSHSSHLFLILREQKSRPWKRFAALVQSRTCVTLFRMIQTQTCHHLEKHTWHDKPGSAQIQHVKYFKSADRKHQHWCHDEAKRPLHAETTQLRHPPTVINLWRHYAHTAATTRNECWL